MKITVIKKISLFVCLLLSGFMLKAQAGCEFDLGDDITGCEGVSVTLSGPANCISYQWYVNSIAVPGANTRYFMFSITSSIQEVSLTIVSQENCTFTDAVLVNASPTPIFDLGENTTHCVGESVSFSGPTGSGYVYYWFVNNNLVSTNANYTHNVSSDALIKLTVSHPDYCTLSDSTWVYAAASPVVNFPSSISECFGTMITLQGPINEYFTYQWYVNNTLIPNNTSFYSFEITTVVDVRLAVSSSFGCLGEDNVIVYPLDTPPDIDFEDEITACMGTELVFEAPTGQNNAYQWFVNNELQSSSASTFTLEVEEDAFVKVVVSNTTTQCSKTDSTQVTAILAPAFDFPTQMSECIGEVITLNAPIGEGFSYQWYLNDELQSNTTSVFSFVIESISKVKLIASTAECSVSDSLMIYTLESPYFEFEDEIDACIGTTVTFEGAVGQNYVYKWYVNDILQPDTTSSTFDLVVSEAAIVRLISYSLLSGCSATDTTIVNPIGSPIFNFEDEMEICAGYIVSLEGPEGDDLTYQWTMNGEILPAQTATLNIVVSDTALISLEVSSVEGCVSSDSIIINTLTSPQIEVFPDSMGICLGQSVALSYSGLYGTYTWFDGSTDPTLIFVPTVIDTIYYLWAEAEHWNGCTARDTAIIRVVKDVDVDLASTTGINSICVGNSIEIMATTIGCNVGDYLVWDDTDTVYFNGTTIYRTYTPTTDTWVRAKIVSGITCFERDSILISVEEPPTITLSDDLVVCRGETLTIEASGAFYYTWYLNEEPFAEGETITINPEETTTYKVVGQTTYPSLCESALDFTVTVADNPVVEITTENNPSCYGTSVVLTATGADSYAWTNTFSTWHQLYIIAEETHEYEVVGTTNYGCSDTARYLLNVVEGDSSWYTGLMPAYCINDVSSNLTGYPRGGFFYGEGVFDSLFNPMAAGAGLHTVNYIYTNEYGCQSGESKTTIVYEEATSIDIGEDKDVCPKDTLFFDAGEDFDKYYWSTGDTTQMIFVYAKDYAIGEEHKISVIGVINGCTAYGEMKMLVKDDCYPGIEETTIKSTLTLIPNPAKDNVEINISEKESILSVEIIDAKGSIVRQLYFGKDGGHKRTINLQEIERGLYILRAISENRIYFGKLLVLNK